MSAWATCSTALPVVNAGTSTYDKAAGVKLRPSEEKISSGLHRVSAVTQRLTPFTVMTFSAFCKFYLGRII